MIHSMKPELLSWSCVDGKSSSVCPWGHGKFPERGHSARLLQNAVGTHEKVSETGVMFAKLTETRIGRHQNPETTWRPAPG